MTQPIELLAPARDYACANEALLHGADAVYMGGPAFGARAAAPNSVADIERAAREAHLYGARLYATLNTILTDAELPEAERLVRQLYEAGVDALIVQDAAFFQLDLPPIALHASTQMDNRTAADVRFWAAAGCEQVVLARELSLEEIRAIHEAVPVRLEAFVHGALCVSYSGQCYASQYCFKRSANRGACAQFCRLAFDLVDARGRVVVRDRHLLSLRDLNRSRSLEDMMDAGVRSFKIEGRLKDVGYVKNVTAYYRRRLDEVLSRRPEYVRASAGRVELAFEPDVARTFNRGFTEYYLHGRTPDVDSPDTPKARGRKVGVVTAVGRRWIDVAPEVALSNGDGLCFTAPTGKLVGFRVNRVEGNRLFPAEMPPARVGTVLYRNYDQAFEQQLARPTAQRRLQVDWTLRPTATGYRLEARDELGRTATVAFDAPHDEARTPQHEALARGLSKLGGTPFKARRMVVDEVARFFIPASMLARARRTAIDQLLAAAAKPATAPPSAEMRATSSPMGAPSSELVKCSRHLTYLANVANSAARAFYAAHGAERIDPAFEEHEPDGAVLMFCRHCLRYSLGYCPKHHGRPLPWAEPLSLRTTDGRLFPLRFDCARCQMKVYAPSRP